MKATSKDGYSQYSPAEQQYINESADPMHHEEGWGEEFMAGGGGGGSDGGGDYSAFWRNVLDAASEFFNTPGGDDQKSYPLTTIPYFFSKAAYLAVNGIGADRGTFNISGTITTLQIGDKFIASVSIGAWSGAIPDNSDGNKYGAQIDFYGAITLYANGNAISRQSINSNSIFFSDSPVLYSADGNYPMPGTSFDLPSVPPMILGIGFQISYQYFTSSGETVSPTNDYNPERAWLNGYQIIYSNYPSK